MKLWYRDSSSPHCVVLQTYFKYTRSANLLKHDYDWSITFQSDIILWLIAGWGRDAWTTDIGRVISAGLQEL